MGSRLKSTTLLLLLSATLFACDSVKNTPSKALDDFGDNVNATWSKGREYLGVGHKLETPRQNKQPRFCYKSIQDITCYSEPIAGQEDRLVAYQTRNGNTGYVLYPKPEAPKKAPKKELPPQPSVNVPLPPKIAGDPTPAAKTAAAPQDAKKDNKKLKEIIFDPSELQPKELVPGKTE